jgi:Ca2+-transporting ATPase
LSRADWLIAIGVSLTISPVLELAKWFERRGWFGKLS